MPLLQLNGIDKSFPGVHALKNISLTLHEGEIHALLGENGAGKSTLMKILSGIYQPDEGEIRINGEALRFANSRQAVAAGVGIIFQEFSLIPGLNAVENIFLNRELRNALGLLDHKRMRNRTRELLARLRVDLNVSLAVSQLSVAQQQFVEIAKALALDARILILDEPTATLTPGESQHLFQVMRDLQQHGVGMLFISHHLEEIFEICDTITVLRDGRYIGTTPVSESNTGQLVKMMVGREVDHNFPPKILPPKTSEPLLEVSLQRTRQGVQDSFQLWPGEIVGFAGLVGSGRTETACALLGAQACWQKQVRINGETVQLNSPADALAKGIGLLPENRKTQGLVLPFSVAHNITLNRQERGPSGFLHHKREHKVVNELIRRVGVKTPSSDTEVNTLSGGNQQKVVIARWLNHECKVLIFDEPTRGIDVGARAEIYQLILQLTQRGIAIIVISSELPEIIGLSHRVLVFRGGHITKELVEEDINAETIMLHATGNAS